MTNYDLQYILLVNEQGVKDVILCSPECCAWFLQIILGNGQGAFGAAFDD